MYFPLYYVGGNGTPGDEAEKETLRDSETAFV